jgi:DNA polymerase/3'-5' exonuclease PolX
MSHSDLPHRWEDASEIGANFSRLIEDVAGKVIMAGSVRRRSALVNDVELVVMPPERAAFFARLDKLVLDGVIEKSVYSNGTYRWGDTYRGLDFQGIRIEVFSATPENVGYITWLRTGPGKANQEVMESLGGWPVRFDEGMAWYTTYEDKVKRLQYKLRVPDETTLFRLIGMQYMPPERRTADAYKLKLKKMRPSIDYIESLKIVDHTPKRMSLF